MKRKLLAAAVCAAAASMAVSSVCFAEGRFKVGFDPESAPFCFMDENGEYTGLDIDLAKAVAELEGWEFIPAPLVWDTRDQVLESGEIDCIWSNFGISGREDLYAWSVPYADSGNVFLVRADSDIQTQADLAGKVLGVESGSLSLEVLSEGGAQADLGASVGRLWQFSNSTNEFMALINGNVDAIVDDEGVIKYNVGDSEDYRILDEPMKVDGLCGVAFLKGNEEMRDTVNEALATLAENGTVAAIAEKYNMMDVIALENVAPAPEEAETEMWEAESAAE